MTFEKTVENTHPIDRKAPRTTNTWFRFRASLRQARGNDPGGGERCPYTTAPLIW